MFRESSQFLLPIKPREENPYDYYMPREEVGRAVDHFSRRLDGMLGDRESHFAGDDPLFHPKSEIPAEMNRVLQLEMLFKQTQILAKASKISCEFSKWVNTCLIIEQGRYCQRYTHFKQNQAPVSETLPKKAKLMEAIINNEQESHFLKKYIESIRLAKSSQDEFTQDLNMAIRVVNLRLSIKKAQCECFTELTALLDTERFYD